MLQFLLLSHLLRGLGPGVMVMLVLAISLAIVSLTGNHTLAGFLGAAVTLFFIALVGVVVLHVVRFFLVAVLSAAVLIKRIVRRF